MRKLLLLPTAFLLSGTPALATSRPFFIADNPLPARMTPWSMFMGADWVVKAVMIGLIAASIVTWAVFLTKHLEFRRTMGAMKRDEQRLEAAHSLDAIATLDGSLANGIVSAAREEIAGCADISHGKSSDAMTDRLSIRLAAVEGNAIQSIRAGFSIFASIGATAPFIGLFGTVWGIMNSFIGISHAQTTNLAVVAPGIAQALLATALGLVAAIPAVLLYNLFSRRLAVFSRGLRNMTSRVACLVSHEVERAQVSRLRIAS